MLSRTFLVKEADPIDHINKLDQNPSVLSLSADIRTQETEISIRLHFLLQVDPAIRKLMEIEEKCQSPPRPIANSMYEIALKDNW